VANRTTRDLLQVESQDVVAWRLRQLLRAGYGRDAAQALAERPQIDLHLATRLLGQGCPAQTAVRILL